MLIDSHCHLTCDLLYPYVDFVLANLEKDQQLLIICTNPTELDRALALKQDRPQFKVAFGWHPEDVDQADLSILSDRLSQIDLLGEIGLDYYWVNDNKEAQKALFIEQILIANQAGLPISIHMRKASEDTLSILKQYAKTKIIFHCFSGSIETLHQCLKLDSLISFAGPITFKNARGLLDVVKETPMDRILSETDAPFLCPLRGQVNHPGHVDQVVQKIAELKQLDDKKVQLQIEQNYSSLWI